jgi:hypothetical protein
MGKLTAIMAVALAAGACSFSQAKETGEAAVVEFHQMMEAGRFHEIYAGASDDLRHMATEAEFSATLHQLHDRLGAVRQTTESDWRVDFTNGNDVVQLQYATEFASGRGQEEFVYQMSGGAARLAGYHVRSPLLRTGAAPSEGNSTAPAPSAADKPSEDAAPAAAASVAPAQAPKPAEPSEPEPAGGK